MSDFQRKFSTENYRRESASKVARRHPQIISEASFDIPIGSWEQTAQEQSKLRGLIKKIAI